MKIRLIALVFISTGFALPFALKNVYPTFLYASIPIVICFWIGFLLLLSPFKTKSELNPYLKWARCAIWANIILSSAFTAYLYLMYYFEPLHHVGIYTLRFFSFLNNPIDYIFDSIMPKPTVQQPDGSVLTTYSFIRMLLTTFFSLVFYSSAGIILKVFKDRKITSRWSGRRGPCRPTA
jgi:hypothetical protein